MAINFKLCPRGFRNYAQTILPHIQPELFRGSCNHCDKDIFIEATDHPYSVLTTPSMAPPSSDAILLSNEVLVACKEELSYAT